MPKSRKLAETLAILAQIRAHPTSEEGIITLRQVLKSKYSLAVAQAAKIVGESNIIELVADLVEAFARMMVKPTQVDQNCLAKKEIAQTLYCLEYSDENLFLQGIRHVQMESVWGGIEDTALPAIRQYSFSTCPAPLIAFSFEDVPHSCRKCCTAAHLRGICALGSVRMNYSDVMNELADLLADPKPEARVAAAKAIAYTGNTQETSMQKMRLQRWIFIEKTVNCGSELSKLVNKEPINNFRDLTQKNQWFQRLLTIYLPTF